MTPRRFKCTQFREGTLDFSLKCIKLLQNDFFKQRYITVNAIIPGQDRIYPNTHLCRTFFAGYTKNNNNGNANNANNASVLMRLYDIKYILIYLPYMSM